MLSEDKLFKTVIDEKLKPNGGNRRVSECWVLNHVPSSQVQWFGHHKSSTLETTFLEFSLS